MKYEMIESLKICPQFGEIMLGFKEGMRNMKKILLASLLLSATSLFAGSEQERQVLARVDAIQQSTDIIGKFALNFSAAVRQPSAQNIDKVKQTLTTPFSLTIVGATAAPVTTADELAAFIKKLSSANTFESRLVGNFSIDSYQVHNNGLRSVKIEALEYPIMTCNGVSMKQPALDQYTVVETKGDVFKVQSVVINGSISANMKLGCSCGATKK